MKLRNFLYWASKVFIFCYAAIFFLQVFLRIPIIPMGLFDFHRTLDVLIWFFSPYIAIFVLIATTPSISVAVRVWKWILGITAAMNVLLLSSLFFSRSDPGMGGAYALIALMFGGNGLIFLELLCLLIGEWIAKRRSRVLNSGSNIVH